MRHTLNIDILPLNENTAFQPKGHYSSGSGPETALQEVITLDRERVTCAQDYFPHRDFWTITI